MSGIKIKLNPAGVRALLRSPRMVADIDRRANRIAAAAGEGHKAEAQAGRRRAIGMVWTDTHDARRGEATDRTLTRAIDAGRG